MFLLCPIFIFLLMNIFHVMIYLTVNSLSLSQKFEIVTHISVFVNLLNFIPTYKNKCIDNFQEMIVQSLKPLRWCFIAQVFHEKTWKMLEAVYSFEWWLIP